MSDYGLKTINGSSGIQIDSVYRNLSLDDYDTSEVIINSNGTTTYYTRVSVNSSPLVPLIAIKPNTDDFVVCKNVVKSSSNFVSIDFVTQYSQSTTIGWKCYRQNRVASEEDYGLKIFNSNEELCFDSGLKYLKIDTVHSLGSFGIPSYEDVSHNDISNPYYILSGNYFWRTIQTNTSEPPFEIEMKLYYVGLKRLSSTSVRVGWFPFFRIMTLSDHSVTYSNGVNSSGKLLICEGAF
jgi:hypothetical protein